MSQLSGLPWWGIVLVATAFTALVMIIWLVARILWLTRHLRQLDLSALAKDCLAFREDLVRFLAERKTSEPSTRQKVFTEEDRLRYVDHSGRTALLLHANFGARAEALAQMLRIAEIPPPNLRGFDTFPDAVGNYFHVVGTLVSKGLLSEARALDPNGPIRVTI